MPWVSGQLHGAVPRPSGGWTMWTSPQKYNNLPQNHNISGAGIQVVYNQLQQKVQKEIMHNEYNDILHAFTFIINTTLHDCDTTLLY